MFDAGTAPGPLCGVPIAGKDIINTNGIATSCGTASLRNWKPDHDAAVVEYLRQAGAELMGKLTTLEFAISSRPEMRQPNNPWGRGYWSGESSSGSDVATAAGLCFGAIGMDADGSAVYHPRCAVLPA
jgi:amidase